MRMAPSGLNCAGGVGKSQPSQRRGSAHSVGCSPNAAVAATKEGQSTRGVLLSEWCC
jgi:hypothetical protein